MFISRGLPDKIYGEKILKGWRVSATLEAKIRAVTVRKLIF